MRERYAHLQGHRITERVRRLPQADDRRVLRRIRLLFRQYRVSSMFKSSLGAKIKPVVVEKLIEQGWLGLKQIGGQ